MKNILIITLVLSFVSCTNNKKSNETSSASGNNALYVIDVDNVVKEELIYFSSYFKDVKTTILETNENCLIGDVKSIRMIDSFIVVTDDHQSGNVFIFDKNGRFIHRLGKVGQGPGEYTYVTDSSIDFERKEIYVFDSYSDNINKYDIASGDFISSIKIYRGNLSNHFIQYIKNKIYTSTVPVSKTGDSFLLQDVDIKTGEQINTYLKASEYNNGGNFSFLRQEGFFYPDYKGGSKFVQMFMNTIVCLEKDSVKPFLVLNAKNWITPEDIQEYIEAQEKNDVPLSHAILFERNISYNIHRHFEIGNLICFQYQNKGNEETVLFDTETKTTRVANFFLDDRVYNGNSGILSPSFTFADSKGVYSYLESEEISRFIEITEAGGINPKLDKLDELKKISEDSNPILFYYERK